MQDGWDALYGLLAGNVWAASAALLGLAGAALTAYAQNQIRAGTKWILTPLARQLPWNRSTDDSLFHPGLSSVVTLVQLFILDADGTRARYEKTTFFVVNRPTTFYQEAVTAEGVATALTTMRGTIVETVVQQGFYVSKIDLGNTLGKGELLTNIYTADLLDSFTKPHEHWTQEFSYPTDHFTLHVHFPAARPPKSISCDVIDGVTEKPSVNGARLLDLFGQTSIVWEVSNPNLHQTLKLGWIW
jgi:hypothetical protein